MPPRAPIMPALRHGLSILKTPTAPLSTTAAPKALRDLGSSSSAMLNLEGSTKEDTTKIISQIYDKIRAPARRGTAQGRQNVEDMIRDSRTQDEFMRQMTRRWRAGEVYSPYDLSPAEMNKWRKRTARRQDLVDLLGLRPLDMYRNFSVISEFMTPHGRIKRAAETGLRPVNQRKMAKAIRRAIGLGLHPSVHHHPELLMREPSRGLAQNR
ncbi:ribosomal protein S18 [Nemania sp. NC0429]|nr:ribosomal protein S18 [Nemania sp. NC0429]